MNDKNLTTRTSVNVNRYWSSFCATIYSYSFALSCAYASPPHLRPSCGHEAMVLWLNSVQNECIVIIFLPKCPGNPLYSELFVLKPPLPPTTLHRLSVCLSICLSNKASVYLWCGLFRNNSVFLFCPDIPRDSCV